MASSVDICNIALTELGEDTIIALTEDSKAARLCNLFYADTRDSLLRMHPWNFAIKRVELAKTVNTPVFEFDSEFGLPSDCLKVIKTDDVYLTYRIEGKKLLANSDSVKIEYISRVEDTTQFDSNFVMALALRLASKIAYNISDNNTLTQYIDARAEAMLKEAKSMNGQEGTPYPVIADTWLNERV